MMSWPIFRRAEFWERAVTKAAKHATPMAYQHRGVRASKTRSSRKCTSLRLKSIKEVRSHKRGNTAHFDVRLFNWHSVDTRAVGRHGEFLAEHNAFLFRN